MMLLTIFDFLYFTLTIGFLLLRVWSVIDHRGCQNVVRTSVTHSANGSCATFVFLDHSDVICDLFLNRRTATWNLLVKESMEHRLLFGNRDLKIRGREGKDGNGSVRGKLWRVPSCRQKQNA